jgi:hypothetical protein
MIQPHDIAKIQLLYMQPWSHSNIAMWLTTVTITAGNTTTVSLHIKWLYGYKHNSCIAADIVAVLLQIL